MSTSGVQVPIVPKGRLTHLPVVPKLTMAPACYERASIIHREQASWDLTVLSVRFCPVKINCEEL